MSRTNGVLTEIRAERAHQIRQWPPEHDDSHDDGGLAMAGAFLAHPDQDVEEEDAEDEELGWAVRLKARNLDNRRRQLVIAAALIVAEIERIDRAGGA